MRALVPVDPKFTCMARLCLVEQEPAPERHTVWKGKSDELRVSKYPHAVGRKRVGERLQYDHT